MFAKTQSWTSLLLAGLVAVPLGCGNNNQPSRPVVDVSAVKGKVTFEGQPTPGATVTFHPVSGVSEKTPAASGIVGDDGSFQLTTYKQNDGAAPGKYKVTAYWTKPTDPDVDGPPLLPLKYSDPQLSGLEIEVQKGTNELAPFNLVP
jgi:hypothetical protein